MQCSVSPAPSNAHLMAACLLQGQRPGAAIGELGVEAPTVGRAVPDGVGGPVATAVLCLQKTLTMMRWRI